MRTILVALAVASAAAAQTTHLVGPGGFAHINAALAVAAPGDVIVVLPGNYTSFQATIGVTIRAAQNGTVFVLGTATANLPAGQTLHLVDLGFNVVSVNGGCCTLDRCSVTPGINPNGPSLSAVNARVHLQGCAVGGALAPYIGFGLHSGLVAQNSTVTAIASSFRGLNYGGLTGQTPGSAGVYLINSTFHGSNLVLEGGDGFSATTVLPGPAITGGQVWISDSTLRGGRAVDLPGQPAWACPADTATGRLARCTLVPAVCANGTSTGPVLGVQRLLPMTSGGQLQLDFRTEPNELVGVWVSSALGAMTVVEIEQPVSLDVGLAVPIALLAADAGGLASATWTLPAGIANHTAWLQGVSTGPLPLQLSPVVGGIVR